MDEFERLKYDGDWRTYGYYKTHKLKIIKQLESIFGNTNSVNLMSM